MNTSRNNDGQEAYALVIFLVLIALLAGTVATFSLSSLYNLQESQTIRDREISYQMARAGLSLWMGRLKEDFYRHNGGKCSSGSGGSGNGPTFDDKEFCQGFDQLSCAASFSITRKQLRCCNWDQLEYDTSTAGSDWGSAAEHHGHPWGWASNIVDSGATIPMADTVYLPSKQPNPEDDDVGYFRMREVTAADAEFDTGTETSCRFTKPNSAQDKVNVNLANYQTLRNVQYRESNGGTIKTLTHDMAMALIEERTGTYDYGTIDRDTFDSNDEIYKSWVQPYFDDQEDVCETLANENSAFAEGESQACGSSGYIWDNQPGEDLYNLDPEMNSEPYASFKYCAHIEGGSLGTNNTPSAKYFLKVKLKRPKSCSTDFQIFTLREDRTEF